MQKDYNKAMKKEKLNSNIRHLKRLQVVFLLITWAAAVNPFRRGIFLTDILLVVCSFSIYLMILEIVEFLENLENLG